MALCPEGAVRTVKCLRNESSRPSRMKGSSSTQNTVGLLDERLGPTSFVGFPIAQRVPNTRQWVKAGMRVDDAFRTSNLRNTTQGYTSSAFDAGALPRSLCR